jgi:hypothetical protein
MRIPGRTGVWHENRLGTPSMRIRQFEHDPAMQKGPRGRWYLMLRENTVSPAASSAHAAGSPSREESGWPSYSMVSSGRSPEAGGA